MLFNQPEFQKKVNLKAILLATTFWLSFLIWGIVEAVDTTRDDITVWLNESVYSDPPAAGTIIGVNDLDRVRSYIPPGYIEEFAYPGSVIAIQPTMNYPGHSTYREATERFKGQARLGSGGELENHTAGRPFSDEQISMASPPNAGLMVGWNQIHRWQGSGYQVDELSMSYLSPTGTDEASRAVPGFEGLGIVERRLTQKFHRVYLNRLAWMPDDNYRIDVPDSDKRFYKDYMEFLGPFDVAGTKFVIERSINPHEEDQVNTYLPTERRVRRLSAKERADSFMGSDVTLDDFDGFAGRVLDYSWTYLGKKKILDVIDTREPLLRFGGPLSRAIIDQWQLRDCHVVEQRPTWEGHPYKSKVLFIDDETYDVAFALAFNHEKKLWKVFDPVYRGARDGGRHLETSVSSWRGQINIDLIGGTATAVQAITDTLHPKMKPSKIKRIFSVSSLTSGQ